MYPRLRGITCAREIACACGVDESGAADRRCDIDEREDDNDGEEKKGGNNGCVYRRLYRQREVRCLLAPPRKRHSVRPLHNRAPRESREQSENGVGDRGQLRVATRGGHTARDGSDPEERTLAGSRDEKRLTMRDCAYGRVEAGRASLGSVTALSLLGTWRARHHATLLRVLRGLTRWRRSCTGNARRLPTLRPEGTRAPSPSSFDHRHADRHAPLQQSYLTQLPKQPLGFTIVCIFHFRMAG